MQLKDSTVVFGWALNTKMTYINEEFSEVINPHILGITSWRIKNNMNTLKLEEEYRVFNAHIP